MVVLQERDARERFRTCMEILQRGFHSESLRPNLFAASLSSAIEYPIGPGLPSDNSKALYRPGAKPAALSAT